MSTDTAKTDRKDQKLPTNAPKVGAAEEKLSVAEILDKEAAAAAPAEEKTTGTGVAKDKNKKRKVVKKIEKGHAHITATYNNTIISITDLNGNVLGWSSAGVNGFKGAKKATPYAASVIVADVLVKVKDYGIKEVDVFMRGIGSGREAAVRALQGGGLEVRSIKDMTPMPHNGPRPRKVRRV